jgi:hypothetical protein
MQFQQTSGFEDLHLLVLLESATNQLVHIAQIENHLARWKRNVNILDSKRSIEINFNRKYLTIIFKPFGFPLPYSFVEAG